MPLPLLLCCRWSNAGERGVAFHTRDAHGLYGQLGFLAADETVMQRLRLKTLTSIPSSPVTPATER